MKKIFLSLISIFIAISCFGQSVEFYGSITTSVEQRFRPSYGLGFQFQQNLSRTFIAGAGLSYYSGHNEFDEVHLSDATPGLQIYQHFKSDAYHFAVRFNIQGLLIDSKTISLTLGPAVSYNVLWGHDQIKERTSQSTSWNSYSQKINKVKNFAVGLISTLEVKNLIAPHVSLCFSIRPEILLGKPVKVMGGSSPPFTGYLSFTEFQIGLKYRFKK